MTRTLIFSIFVAELLAAASPPAPEFLLPDDAEPRRYAIELTINPAHETFHGVARIDLALRRSVFILWLNGRGLTVESASLSGAPARVVAAHGEFLGFALQSAARLGPARLEISYRGHIDSRTATGVYRRRSGGDWYVFTTFTAIEARRAFPCFDEPRFKAPWQLTLHVPRAATALSNTRAVGEDAEAGGMKRVEFAPTEPLPSDLVAFAVGPFEVVDAGRAGKNSIPVRIITPRGRASEAAAAREATPRLLAQLEDYTGIPYPFDKIDHLALIEGAFGAIENPGLITYQQRILLAPPAQDSDERRRRMRSTMAHELAHQWFGNLVTMRGWEDVWLSEGFATWMGGKIMDSEEPAERRGLAQASARDFAMAADTRPVRLSMRSREEMRQVYGRLVYDKGAAALRMVENWLGDDTVREGLRRYLNGHRFGNAGMDDLTRELSPASRVLHSVLDQEGVPLLRVEARCEPGRARIALHQERYLPLGARGAARVWDLPVCLKGDGLAAHCVEMEGPEAEVPLTACPAWVFANAGGAGYYRTLMAPALAAGVAKHAGELTSAERLTFARDVLALVRNGRIPAGEALDLLPAMAADSEPMVAATAASLAGTLGAIVPPGLKAKYGRRVSFAAGASVVMKPGELELFRAAQQKSLVEALSREGT